MGWYFHIAEVAALLLVAYSIGWGIGFAARRATARTPVAAVIPEARLERARGAIAPAPMTAAAVAVEPVVPAATAPAESLAPAREEPLIAGPDPALPPVVPAAASIIAPPEPALLSAMDTVPREEATIVDPAVAPISGSPAVSLVSAENSPEPGRTAPGPSSGSAALDASQEASGAVSIRSAPPVVRIEPEVAADDADEIVILGRPLIAAGAPSIPAEAAPASAPGMAWAGEINGHAAPLHMGLSGGQSLEPPTAPAPAEPPRETTPPDMADVEPDPSPAMPDTAPVTTVSATAEPDIAAAAPETPNPIPEPAPFSSTIVVPGREPAPALVDHDAMFAAMFAEPVPDDSGGNNELDFGPAEPVEAAPPPAPVDEAEPPIAAVPEPEPIDGPPPPVAPGEDDAMRAIEGGWSGNRPGAATDQPEVSDVAAAVAAAQTAVQQAINLTGAAASVTTSTHAFGRPIGLPRPRDGRRDNLRDIEGMSPLDESTLNNLGIYHFDQIAEWTPQEVFWLENHVFARGRIGRETWQLQARDLMTRRPPPSRFARL